MRLNLAVFITAFYCCALQAQFTDNFSDSDLKKDPEWFFTPGDFEILDGRLHTTNANGGSVVYGIWANNTWSGPGEFSFDMELNANPSGSNYIDVFISCDTVPLLARNGYFIRIGDTKDKISFYRMANSVITEVIAGPEGELNKSTNAYHIHLYLNESGIWQMNYTRQGETNPFWLGKHHDSFPMVLPFTGFRIVQNGTGIIGKHFFDNLFYGPRYRDTVAPVIKQVEALFPNSLRVLFNERIGEFHNADFLLNRTEIPVLVERDTQNPEGLMLTFASAIPKNQWHILNNRNTADTSGNHSTDHDHTFFALFKETAEPGDIIFTEVMVKPAPSVNGLPEAEYIEIKNTGSKYLSLKNCTLSDGNLTALLPDSLLLPYSYAILTKKSALIWPVIQQKLIQTSSFPSLDNAGDQIILYNREGAILTSLSYSENWHSDALKQGGGWSLELTDTGFACIPENNWKSNKSNGGTPGNHNSTYERLSVIPEFKALRTYMPDARKLRIFFSQNPDSASIKPTDFYIADLQLNPVKICNFNPFDHSLDLDLGQDIAPNKVYELQVSDVMSCSGMSSGNQMLKFGIAKSTLFENQVRINEILFNPWNDEPDYLEIFNSSDSIIDLKFLILASMKNDIPSEIKEAAPNGYALFPGCYALFTTDPRATSQRYPEHDLTAFINIASLPVFPNDKGHVALYSKSGIYIDGLKYEEGFHAPVVSNPEGISLEKVSTRAPSDNRQYWTSAASNAGFGTPGKANSQNIVDAGNSQFSLKSDWFSPDNDGMEDLLGISYSLEHAGYSLNSAVFSESGIMIDAPHKNYLLATTGIITWDGLTDKGLATPGNYVILLEGFEPGGKKFHYKFTFSVLKNI